MLTSKQRSYLRALANNEEPIFQVGKSGVTDMMVAELRNAIEAHELIKITVLRNADVGTKEVLAELAEKLNAEPVASIGFKAILYKPNRKNPKIVLPR